MSVSAMEAPSGAASDESRLLVISCDSHAQGRASDFRPHVEQKYLGLFDEWAATMLPPGRPVREEMMSRMAGGLPKRWQEYSSHPSVAAGGEDGIFDFSRRLSILEADGIVGEVVIQQGLPFMYSGLTYSTWTNAKVYEWDVRRAGIRAANAWLAEACSQHPGRYAGIAVISDMEDVKNSADELAKLFAAGLRGGVILADSPIYEWPAYNHERYYPLWEVLNEYKLPVHTHIGQAFSGPHTSIDGPGGNIISGFEAHRRKARPFWSMYYGGVFDKFPNLRFVFTEHGKPCEWIPEMISDMMGGFLNPTGSTGWRGFELSPAEVWQQRCYAGAAYITKGEVEQRHALGVSRTMWGSDYPHIEGTWPKTRESLRESLWEIPEDEKRQILGENALRCYEAAFDGPHLRSIANAVGLARTDVGPPRLPN